MLVTLRVGVVAVFLLALAAPAAAAPPDLVGTWHLLVHYKDKGTNNPDTERWEDRIWEFKLEGSRLVWVDYPIVVFEDKSGRFDSSGGRNARVLHHWEPNGSQRREIREGLAINQRGSRTKSLKGSATQGWTSAKRRRGYQSASVITFEETWTIEFDGDLPTFTRDDVMGSASTESMEGRTLYAAEAIDGDVITGRFERDAGTRYGTFRLMRSGEAKSVGSGGKTLQDRAEEGQSLTRVLAGHLSELSGDHDEGWYRSKVDDGSITRDERLELRAAFEQRLYEALGSNDERTAYRTILTNLAVKMERLFVEDGKSVSDLQDMLRKGTLEP